MNYDPKIEDEMIAVVGSVFVVIAVAFLIVSLIVG
jgi:hypothetical protein